MVSLGYRGGPGDPRGTSRTMGVGSPARIGVRTQCGGSAAARAGNGLLPRLQARSSRCARWAATRTRVAQRGVQ